MIENGRRVPKPSPSPISEGTAVAVTAITALQSVKVITAVAVTAITETVLSERYLCSVNRVLQ